MKKILILKVKRGVDQKATKKTIEELSSKLKEMGIAHIVMTDNIEYEVVSVSSSKGDA